MMFSSFPLLAGREKIGPPAIEFPSLNFSPTAMTRRSPPAVDQEVTLMFPFRAEEITPVRDRGAPVGNGPVKDPLRGRPELSPFIMGKTLGLSPRIQPGPV